MVWLAAALPQAVAELYATGRAKTMRSSEGRPGSGGRRRDEAKQQRTTGDPTTHAEKRKMDWGRWDASSACVCVAVWLARALRVRLACVCAVRCVVCVVSCVRG